MKVRGPWNDLQKQLLTETYRDFHSGVGEVSHHGGPARADGEEGNLRFNGGGDKFDGTLNGCQMYQEDQTEVRPHLHMLFSVKDQWESGMEKQSSYKELTTYWNIERLMEIKSKEQDLLMCYHIIIK